MSLKRKYSALDPVVAQLHLQDYYTTLHDRYKRLQFVISNTTDSPQEIRLWGANSSISLTQSSRFTNSFNNSTSVGVGNYPQGIVYNPATDLFYVANQLSDTISILDAAGTPITTIALSPVPVPSGSYSPIALAVNTRADSPGFGEVYVVNSVRDSISVIDRNLTLVAELLTGKRPIGIGYNPVDDMMYVVSLTDATLFAIATDSRLVAQRPLEGIPFSVGIDPSTGHIVVNIPELNSVYLYDIAHQRLAIFEQIGARILAWAFHPLSNQLYGVVENDASLLIINTLTIAQQRIPIDGVGLSIAYSQAEGLLYIGEVTNGQLLRLDEKDVFVTPFPVSAFETGIAIHPENGSVALSQATQNTVSLIGVNRAEVTIVENYNEFREEFRSFPALVKHLKVVSSDQLMPVLFLEDRSISGKTHERIISISSHQSPRNFLSVAEVFQMEDTLIDGRHQWRFTINPQTRITLLLYYKQLEINKLID